MARATYVTYRHLPYFLCEKAPLSTPTSGSGISGAQAFPSSSLFKSRLLRSSKKKVILQARHGANAIASEVWARDLVSKIPPPTAERCHHLATCIFAVRTGVGWGRVVVLASGVRVAVQNMKFKNERNSSAPAGNRTVSQRKIPSVRYSRKDIIPPHRSREAIAFMLLLLVKREGAVVYLLCAHAHGCRRAGVLDLGRTSCSI